MIKSKSSFIITSLLLLLCSCGGSDGDSFSTENSYTGPGSFWSANLSSSTFSMERRNTAASPVDLTVNGTVSTLSSGYKMLTVSSASGTNAPSVGEQAYALEIPGFLTLVKPLNSVDDKILPMLASGDCPSSDFDFNWIVTDYKGSSNIETSADIVGVANFTNSSTSFNISSQYSLDGSDVTSAASMSGTCSNGFMQIDTDSNGSFDTDMWLSTSGSALVKTPEDTIIVAMPSESFSSTNLVNKEFSGLVFDESNTGDKVNPVWISIDGTGSTASAGSWDDIQAATKNTADAEITFNSFDNPEIGFVQASLSIDTNGDGSFDLTGGNIICQYKGNIVSSGKDILFCAGHKGGNTTDLFNVLLISQ